MSDHNDGLLTIEEVMAWAKLGRTTINAELRSGRLVSVKICGRRRIPISALVAWFQTAAQEPATQSRRTRTSPSEQNSQHPSAPRH
jgi:hypothetical protein